MAADRVTRVATSQILNEYAMRMPRGTLLAELLAPVRTVTKNMFRYRIFGRDRFREADNDWAPGTVPNEIRSKWSEGAVVIPERKLRHLLLDSEVANADDDLNLAQEYTGTVVDATLISREARVARLFTTTGNYASGHVLAKAGGAEWNAAGVVNTIQPITDLNGRISLVSNATRMPRTAVSVVIPQTVYDTAIRENTGILDAFKYTSGAGVGADVLAQRLGVREVLLANSRAANGPEVAGEDITGIAETDLWGENVWVGVRADAAAAETNITFARAWRNVSVLRNGAMNQDVLVRRYRHPDEGAEADYIEGKEAQVEMVVANFAGALITNTLA